MILIAIFWLLFASFSSASFSQTMTKTNYTAPANWTKDFTFWNWLDIACFWVSSSTNASCITITNNSNTYQLHYYNSSSIMECFTWFTNTTITLTNSCDWNISVSYFWYSNSYPYQNYTSLQCQTEYNLIPILSVDSNYCISNNLCSSSDCPSYTWDLTPWVSNVWINDLFHPWAFNIIMNIPEEIDWDYAYTNSWQNMNIDVVWYNVDYDYINDVVDTQNYKPSSSDLSSIVSQIIPLFVPWLCIILLLYFIFRFIKKIF